jgi:hypothetical protein
VIKLCAAVALACVAGVAPTAVAEAAGAAEARARAAVAPLAVESAVCIPQSRRRSVCLLAHPDAGGLECRSAVVVRRYRVRVVQRNVCFELREVKP